MPNGRSYTTGRTLTFTARATLTLNYCGGTFISGDPEPACTTQFDNGWLGSNFFRPLDKQCFGQIANGNEFHSVSFTALGQEVGIDTFIEDTSPPDGAYGWFTRIDVNGTPVKTWNQGPFGTVDEAPETVRITVTITLTAEEWVDELDTDVVGSADNVRPTNAYDAHADIYWKPVGSGLITITGDYSHTESFTPPSRLQVENDLAVFAEAEANQPYAWGQYELDSIPQVAGLNALGAGPFASVSGMSLDGTLANWEISKAAADGSGFSETSTNLSAYDFTQTVPFEAPHYTLTGKPALNVPVVGAVRDWNGPVSNIPISFDGGVQYAFTGTHVIQDQPDPTVHPPAGFSLPDVGAALLRYGAEWSGITLNRLSSLSVETFSNIGGAYGWAGTDCSSGPAYGSGTLTVTGAGSGSPRIDKALKSDFDDIEADPDGWWTANGASLSAEVQDWWAATGDPSSSPHRGDWWRIGKRLLSGSDVFNWSSYRYLDLTGYADADCTVTLRIEYDEITFSEGTPYDVTATRTPKTVTYDVDLTTSSAAHRVDLASKAGQHGLRYARTLRVSFPTGRTLHLSALTLVEASRPVVDVHLPSVDMAVLTAQEDGKHCLFLSTPDPTYPNSVWGWPCLRRMDVTIAGVDSSRYQSLTLSELKAEIDLQEGWSASGVGTPDHGSPGYAVWLKEVFEQACPVTLKGRRAFGRMSVYANYQAHGGSIDLEANLGNAVSVLVFDPDTFLPVRVPIEADDPTPAVRDTAATDATGHGRLELTTEESYTVYAGRGSASESSFGVDTVNRTIQFPSLTAKEEGTGTGPVVIDIDRLGNRWLTYVHSNLVKLGRKLGEGSLEEYDVGAVGDNAWVHTDETSRPFKINVVFHWGSSTIYMASSLLNGLGRWKLADIATGSRPFLRVDKATGIYHFLYWRADSGGTIFLKRSTDGGLTFLESEIAVVTGVTEQTVTFDFALDQPHTMVLVYDDGGTIKTLTSTDNGRTFA